MQQDAPRFFKRKEVKKMAYEVLFQVSWIGGKPSEVVPIAEKHYNDLNRKYHYVEPELKNREFKEGFELLKEQPSKEAIQFLKDIYCCRGYHEGTKGIFWSWGIVGNHLIVDTAIRDLIPFFQELYSRKILTNHDKIIVMSERESTETVEIFQLSWGNGKITIDTFKNNEWFWGV